MNLNKAVSDYIREANSGQVEILKQLRRLIHSSVPETSEAIKWGFPVFSKTKDYAYLSFSKHHITVGFYNIDKIVDNHNLLEGKGTTMKHIKIHKQVNINEELLKQWFKSIAI